MNKPLNSSKLLAAISLIPESAPFDVEQRAWLNGFFAGMTGMEEIFGRGPVANPAAPGAAESEPEEEDFPWHDANMGIDDRLKLAEDRPQQHKLMAAMAQLDCGSCGYVCETYSEAIASGAEPNLTLCSPGGKETARALKQLVKLGDATQADSPPAAPSTPAKTNDSSSEYTDELASLWSRKNPFDARLIDNQRLTGEGSAKDVRHVEIDLSGSGLSYDVGDSLGIYPTNCQELMENIVTECESTAGADPSVASRFLEIKNVSAITDELVEWFVQNLCDTYERKHCEAVAANDEMLDELDVLDFLKKFKSTRIPLLKLVECLPNLNPRLYSIASSLKKHPGAVHLTVGKVTYEKSERIRKGVASTMLAERVTGGSSVHVFVQPSHGFTVPADPTAPMIMVGPGTGIAPFVSFLQERESTQAGGKNWLFFGDQKSSTDFLYREMLEDYRENGLLARLDTAFSRDQAHKVYVQDRMRENGAELFQWLEDGGYFFVCGDASRMAKDVDAALHEIIEQHGSMSAAEAADYVKRLAAESRYGRDVY